MSYWLRSLFRRRAVERELDAELRFHVEERTDELIAQGAAPAEARRRARMEFGGAEQVKEAVRDARGWRWLEDLAQDARYASRTMRRSPGLFTAAILSLALGIGANSAIFTLINAVILRSLPVHAPRQLVSLTWQAKKWPEDILKWLNGSMSEVGGATTGDAFSYPTFDAIRRRARSVSGVTASQDIERAAVTVRGRADVATGLFVSGEFFDVLGIPPAYGRLLEPADDRAGAAPVAVISHGFWSTRFGADPAAVGATIAVNGAAVTVVGVTPQSFFGLRVGRAPDIFVPLHAQPLIEPRMSADGSLFERTDAWWLYLVARRRPGVSDHQLRAELSALLTAAQPAGKKQDDLTLVATPAAKGLAGVRENFSKPLWILAGVVGLVLLIACANVANLLLARTNARRREIAMRLALGAGRGRLVRQLLTEALLVAALGGLMGLAIARWTAASVVAMAPHEDFPVALDTSADLGVLAFTAALSMLTGILFGLAPALQATAVSLTPGLKSAATQSGLPRRGFLAGRALVCLQTALSLVLLIGATLFARTLANTRAINPGFDAHNLVVFGLDPFQAGYRGARIEHVYRRIKERIEAAPGVESVALSSVRLISGRGTILIIAVEGFQPKKPMDTVVSLNFVSPGYFQTMRIPLRLGRTIEARDAGASPKVAVVDEEFVRRFLGAGSPLGKRFTMGEPKSGDWVEIVGVAQKAKYNDLKSDAPGPSVYAPVAQFPEHSDRLQFAVRTVLSPAAAFRLVREQVAAVDRNLPPLELRTEREQIDEMLARERLLANLCGAFAMLALVLSAIGLYGVLSYTTSRRRAEIGIRMALGAARRQVIAGVLQDGMASVAVGAVVGIAGALAGSRLIGSFLYGLKPADPVSIAAAAAMLFVTAALAAVVPALRAARVDPAATLRSE